MMDLRPLILTATILAATVSSEDVDDGPSNLRMDVSQLLMEAKNAVRIAKLRKALVQERKRHALLRERQRIDAKGIDAAVKKERAAGEEARAAVAEVRAAVAEARMAMKSLENVRTSDRQAMPTAALEEATKNPAAKASGELTDPDESSADVRKLVKKTHENMEKKPDREVVISKGMTKDVVKANGQVAKKLVKESEDKKPNGEEIIDKQANLEIDRDPAAKDPEDPAAEALKGDNNSAPGLAYQVFNLLATAIFTFVLVV